MAHSIGRRDLLRGLGLAGAAGLAAVGASGCGSFLDTGITGGTASRNALTFWNLFSGGDGVRMVEMEKKYQRAHPEVNLDAITLTWGNPYYTKLELAALSGRAPNVAVTHLSKVATLAQAGLLSTLDETELSRYGMTADRFTTAAWSKAHVGGTLRAVPLDTHPFVLYYRTDVCEKAGLLDPDGNLKPIVGTDGFIAALRKAAKVTGGYGGVVNIIGDPSTCWRWFATLYYQLGGQVLADDGRTVALDDAKATEALRFMRELTVQRKLMPSNIDGGGVTSLFSTGKVGFMLDGEWDITTYQTAKTPFNMVPLPNFYGGKYTCFADSHALILPTGGNPDPSRRDVSLTFVRSLLDSSLTWAQGGHIPAWKPVQDSDAYRTMKPQSNYTQAAYAASYDPPGWYSGAGSDFETVVGSAVSAVESGQLSPEAGAAQMRSGLTSYTTIKPPVA